MLPVLAHSPAIKVQIFTLRKELADIISKLDNIYIKVDNLIIASWLKKQCSEMRRCYGVLDPDMIEKLTGDTSQDMKVTILDDFHSG